MLVQERLHFKSRLAAHSSCGDGLTINGVCHVTCGKNTGNIRARRLTFGYKIARCVHIQLSLEQFGVRVVSDSQKEATVYLQRAKE